MPEQSSKSRWIVQGAAVRSGALARHVSGDPAVTHVRHVAADVVILAMSADRARRLGAELPGLVVEADAELDH